MSSSRTFILKEHDTSDGERQITSTLMLRSVPCRVMTCSTIPIPFSSSNATYVWQVPKKGVNTYARPLYRTWCLFVSKQIGIGGKLQTLWSLTVTGKSVLNLTAWRVRYCSDGHLNRIFHRAVVVKLLHYRRAFFRIFGMEQKELAESDANSLEQR